MKAIKTAIVIVAYEKESKVGASVKLPIRLPKIYLI